MTMNFSEDSLIEQPSIVLLASLGWDTADCYEETFGTQGTLGRGTSSEVVLLPRLRSAMERINPDLSPEAFHLAIEELSCDLLLPKLISGQIDVSELSVE